MTAATRKASERARRKADGRPSKERVRDVMNEVDALDLSDGAHWALIHDRLGLEYGDVFDYVTSDPKFYGYSEPKDLA